MSHTLFVTEYLPQDPSEDVHGVYQRLRMLLGAADQVSDRLDLLFLTDRSRADRYASDPNLERTLRRLWNVTGHIEISPTNPPRLGQSFAAHYLYPLVSCRRKPLFSASVLQPHREAFQRALACGPDTVFFHRIGPAPLLGRKARSRFRVIIDIDDIEHVKRARELLTRQLRPGILLGYLELPSLAACERLAIAGARHAFVCSEGDARYLSRFLRLQNVSVIPNAVAIPAEHCAAPDESVVMFVGSFEYGPNVAAAEYLVEKVWPLVARRIPEARLRVIGRSPERLRCYGKGERVEYLGFVDDLAAQYRAARLICAPIFVGSGTRVKLLEAAAHGKAIVTTRIGVEGIPFCDGVDMLLGEDSQSLADQCCKLLSDIEFSNRLGSAARGVVAGSFDQAVITRELIARLQH